MSLEKLFKNIEKEGKIELSDDFKATLTEAVEVIVSEEKSKVESLEDENADLVTENETLKADIDTLKENVLEEVKKEVETYKEQLVEKISAYLDSEMENLIPEDAIEAIAKVEVYEPLVEGFKRTIARYGIEMESEGHSLLREAKEEIERLREEYDEATSKAVELTNEMEKINSTVTLMEKCDGLTDVQKKKMLVIFKNKSVDEINERFDEVRDMIVENASTTEEREDKKKDIKPVVVNENVESRETNSKELNENEEDLGQRLL
jgi:hypothetical protein